MTKYNEGEMRWYLETQDGRGLMWQADFFDDGRVEVLEGKIGGRHSPVVHELGSLEDAVPVIRALAAPFFDDGFAEVLHPDERFQPHPRIATFFSEQLLADWQEMGVTAGGQPDYRDLYVTYMACKLPSELDQFLAWRSEYDFGYCNYGEWRIWDADRWLPKSEDGNLFEQLVLMDQRNYLGTSMMEHFASWVFIGTAGNGDSYFAHPNMRDPNQAEVVFFNHETHSPDFFIADSIGSLAWLNRCYVALESEDFDQEAWVEDFSLLEERTQLSWHYGDLEEEAELECSYEKKSDGLYYFFRAVWLDMLLRPKRASVKDIEGYFYEQIHAGLNFEETKASVYLRSSPITALYWIWRLFWFDRPELEECLGLTEEHASPIVRDCVALIRELLGGRKQLGEIEDIFARREAFLALDLDPDRAEQRAAEQAEAERLAEEERLAKIQRATDLISSASVDQVREALWDYVGEEDALDVLYDHLEANDPESFPWIDRRRFLTDGADYEFKFEREDFAEVLRALKPAVLAPRFPGTALGAAVAGNRVMPFVQSKLDTEDEYNHAMTEGVRALAAMDDPTVVPKLIEITQSMRWTPGDWLGELHNKDAVLAAVDGLSVYGGADAARALLDLLDTELVKLHPRVLASLGRMRAEGITAKVEPFLETEFARPALFALAQVGAADAVDAFAGVLAGSYVSLAYERAMQQLANLRAGRSVDWDLVDKLTTVIESKKYEDMELHEALVELVAEHPDDASVRLELYLHHDHERLRTLSFQKLREIDSGFERRFMDHWAVHQIWEAEGAEGLRAALKDRHALLRGNVMWKAIEEGCAAELVDEVCAFVGELTRFEHYTNGYVQDAHKRTEWAIKGLSLIDHPTARRALCRLWKGANPMYRMVDVLKYNRDDIHDQLQPYVEEIEAEFAKSAPPELKATQAVEFCKASWLFGGSINAMEWAPDGELLAVAGAGGVKLFDAAGKVVRSFSDCRGAWVYDVSFSPDGKLLAAGAHGGHLWLLNPESGALVAKLTGHGGVPNGVRKVRFSPSGSMLASVSDDQTARVWNVGEQTQHTIWEDPADVNTVDWLDDACFVIGTDRMLRVIDLEGAELAHASCAGVAEARVHSERGRIYVGTAHSHLRVFDLDLTEIEEERLDHGSVARIRFRGEELAVCCWEGELVGASVLAMNGSSFEHLPGHASACFGLALNPQDGTIATGGSAGVVARWNAAGEECSGEELFHTNELSSFRFANGEVLTTADDGAAIRWTTDGQAIASYRNPNGRVCDAVRDGDHVFVTGLDFTGCFELNGTLVWSTTPNRSEFLTLTSDAVVIASYDQLVWLDRSTGEVLEESGSFCNSFLIRWVRLDEKRICCTGFDDKTDLYVWDLESREMVATWSLPASEKGGICANLSAAGGKLFVSRWDKTLLVLDASDGRLLKKAALSGTRYPIAASLDGRRVFTVTGQSVEAYDSESFEMVGRAATPSPIEEAAVGPDGSLYLGAKSGEIFTVGAER